MMRDTSAYLRRLRTLFTRPEAILFVLAVLLLAASITAYEQIPWWSKPWGMDLQNLHAFHTCASRDDPYAATGRQCGDLYRRDMFYPPMLYWSFVWIRQVSFSAARWIWASLIVAVLLWVPVAWSRPAGGSPRSPSRWAVYLFGALLITQFPAVFAIERGNNDILVVLLWSLALGLFLSGRHFLTGCSVGLAVGLKLYPAFAAVVLAAGFVGAAVRGGRLRWIEALRFGAGIALVLVAGGLLFFKQTMHYVTGVLPAFASRLPGATVFSHSIPGTFRDPPSAPRLISGALVLLWAAVAFVRFSRAPREIFAGALAISTFVAATSYDYNLITAYPLLLVLLLGALQRWKGTDHRPLPGGERERGAAWVWGSWAVLGVGLVAVVAHRAWFTDFPRGHVILELLWLALAAGLIVVAAPRQSVEVELSSP